MNHSTIITIVLVAVTFAILWWSGQLVRMKNYCDETWVEMQKCTWPTWGELKGSTVVVMISLAILGVFTMLVDFAFAFLVRKIN